MTWGRSTANRGFGILPRLGLGRRWTTWGVVAGLWILSLSAGAYEMIPASISGLLMERLDLGQTGFSLIISVMFGGIAVASIPVGFVLDRMDVRWAILFASGALITSGLWSWRAAAAGTYWQLLAARAVGGLAYVIIWTGGMNVVANLVEPQIRATAIGAYIASGSAGFAVGLGTGPLIAEQFGPLAIFPVFPIISLAGSVLFVVFATSDVEATAVETPRLADFGRVFTTRSVVAVCAMGFIAYSLYLFLNSWMPAYLVDVYDVSLVHSGWIVALFPAMGVFARGFTGLLSDKVFDQRRRPVTRLTFAVVLPVVVGLAVAPTAVAVFALLVLGGTALQFGIGLFFAYVRELVDENVAATALALLTAVSMAGSVSAPLVTGALIERTGGYLAAFAYATVLGVAGLVLTMVTPEPNPTKSDGER